MITAFSAKELQKGHLLVFLGGEKKHQGGERIINHKKTARMEFTLGVARKAD